MLYPICSSKHKLAVEAFRWHKPMAIPYVERTCLLCELQELEDEYHFVIVCPLYEELRRRFVPRYYTKHPSMFKFIELMNEPRQSVQRKLAMFIFYATAERESVLY